MTAAPVAMRDAFGATLVELAETHPEMVVLDADVASSTRTAGDSSGSTGTTRTMPRSIKAKIFPLESGVPRNRKHASEMTASHVTAGWRIAKNSFAAHSCH